MTPDEMREALAAAFMHEGTFRDLQANDDWGHAAADLALTVVADGCICPLAPVVYEGPQEDCEVHGERRSVLIGQRDEARAALKAAQAENERLHREMADVLRGGLSREVAEAYRLLAERDALRAALEASESENERLRVLDDEAREEAAWQWQLQHSVETDGEKPGSCCAAHGYKAERDDLRATVERVRAACDQIESNARSWLVGDEDEDEAFTALIHAAGRIRAALDGEDGG